MTGLEGVIASLDEGRSDQQKCSIAMDCIVLVNQLRIDTSTETMTSDLANQFVAKVQAEARGFLTLLYLPLIVMVITDETQVGLLKQQTWINRYKDNVTPRTVMKKIKLKDLLSHKTLTIKELLYRL